MDREAYKELMIHSLKHELSEQQKMEMEAYMKEHPKEREELDGLKAIWETAEMDIPRPSEQMDAGFYAMLAKETKTRSAETQETSWFRKLELLFSHRLAYAFILIVAFAGGMFFQNQLKNGGDVQLLTSEVQEMKKMMMLTLIEQPAAQDRIRAVSMVEEINNGDQKVMMALLKTLNEDPNVNVRLSVIEVLGQKKLSPMIRAELVKSIGNQHNPLVQAAMADLMVLIQEKSSVDALEKLLQQEDLNPLVKEKIDESLEVLI